MKRIYRSRSNRVLAGVCGGLGEYFAIDPVLVRVGMVAMVFFGGGGLIAYLLAALIIPLAPKAGHPEESESAERTAPRPPETRETRTETMHRHIQLLGGLYLILSSLFLIGAVVAFFALAGGGWISGDETAITLLTTIASVVAGILVLIALPGMLCGWGLLRYRPWARTLGLVLGILNLINFPFGTALGVYTLWVMMQPETETLFVAPETG